jgi:hypothetical protein
MTAQVFLRSTSGRSIRELGEAPLPTNLKSYRAPREARDAVRRWFEDHSFRVYVDDAELTMSVEADPKDFRAVFGKNVAAPSRGKVMQTERLPIPQDIRQWVEEIVVLPPPDLHV